MKNRMGQGWQAWKCQSEVGICQAKPRQPTVAWPNGSSRGWRHHASSSPTLPPCDPPTLACRSASLYTATVGTPSRCAVVRTRHAISPRLATSSLSIAGRPVLHAAALLLSARWPCHGLARASAACRPAASRRRARPWRIAAQEQRRRRRQGRKEGKGPSGGGAALGCTALGRAQRCYQDASRSFKPSLPQADRCEGGADSARAPLRAPAACSAPRKLPSK